MSNENALVTTRLDTLELICFTLEGQEFGIPITSVKEIIQPPPITRVVHTTDLVAGVINVRGVILAVLNVKQILNLQDTSSLSEAKIVHVYNQDKSAGVLVDNVEVVKEVSVDDIRQLESSAETNATYFDGVVQLEDHPLTILSVSKILNAPELMDYQEK